MVLCTIGPRNIQFQYQLYVIKSNSYIFGMKALPLSLCRPEHPSFGFGYVLATYWQPTLAVGKNQPWLPAKPSLAKGNQNLPRAAAPEKIARCAKTIAHVLCELIYDIYGILPVYILTRIPCFNDIGHRVSQKRFGPNVLHLFYRSVS